MRGQPGAVGVDPAPQAGPGGQQRLVGDLDGVLVDGEQPARDEEVEHLADLTAPGQLRALHPAPRVGQVRGDVHEPQEDPPDELLPIGGQLGERLLRGLRHAARDAAHRVVVGDGHPHALTPPPRRQQRVRQQGQQARRAGLGPGPVHVGEQDLDQAVLDRHAGLARGFDDGAAQVGVVHRPDDHLRLLGGTGEFGVPQRAAVEVGAQGDHHRRGERAQLLDERGALVLVDGRAEDLLELVDDQERGVGGGRRERGERGLARREQHRWAAVRRGRGERRDDTGPQHRRLARAGGTDHHQGPVAGAVAERRHDDVHQGGASEEPGRILGPEALQPAVGVKNLAVVTPGFSADCLETLEEIAVENADIFRANGGENFAAIPCLNDSERRHGGDLARRAARAARLDLRGTLGMTRQCQDSLDRWLRSPCRWLRRRPALAQDGAWTMKKPLPAPRNEVALAAVGGKLYVVGGSVDGEAVPLIDEYDPASDWLARARADAEGARPSRRRGDRRQDHHRRRLHRLGASRRGQRRLRIRSGEPTPGARWRR